jgi:hypothetical protein
LYADQPPPPEGFLPGVAESKLLKKTNEEALRNPELAALSAANGKKALGMSNGTAWIKILTLPFIIFNRRDRKNEPISGCQQCYFDLSRHR